MYKLGVLIFSIFFLLEGSSRAQQKEWKLVWSDEFNYTGLPDKHKWDYESGFVRNGEPQYYTVKRLENCRVENGMLVIEARKEEYPNAHYKPGSAKASEQRYAHYTSASINTSKTGNWKYGRMEIRAKLPAGLGCWPAFWMLGINHDMVRWPGCGEIDIMEFLGRDSTRVHGTVHYADSLGNYGTHSEAPVVGQPIDGFHIYALEWYPDRLEFYYDHLKYFVFDIKEANSNDGNTFKKKFYLLLDLALGHHGSWAGPVNEQALPFKYYVDYVRVYQ